MRVRWLIPYLMFATACSDGDPQQASVRLVAAIANPEGGTVTVIARRSGDPGGEVTASYATADASALAGPDYTMSAGTLRWADGDTEDKAISIAILDDLAIEGDEMFTVALSNAIGAPIAGGAVRIVIQDDDRVGDTLALTSSGRLVSFDRASPAVLRHAAVPSGLAGGEAIVGMDFRPRDAKLYAITNLGELYTVELASGALSPTSSLVADPGDTTEPFAALSGTTFGVDFNPVVDRLRVVSDTGQNLRVNVETGRTFTDATIRGAATGLAAAGYENNHTEACRTKLYAIDPVTDRLVLQDPPNDGTTTAIGTGLGVDAGRALLDLVTGPTGATAAFAILSTGAASGLYTIDLAAGTASLVDTLSLAPGETVHALAIPIPAPIGSVPQAPGELYGVTEGNRMITFNRAAPSKTCTSAAISGLAPQDTIVGIDVRPSTGVLYALARRGGQGTLYVLDPVTGAASSPVTLGAALAGTSFGVDFNPTGPVALRIVSDTGQNLRVTDVTTGATAVDAVLNGPSVGAGGAAYTNSVQGTRTTTLYTIDAVADRLRIQNPPDTGAQNDVGALGVDVAAVDGFEIDGRDNTAFVALALAGGGATTFHTVDLATGAVSASLGAVGGGERLRGLTRPAPTTTVFGLLDPDLLVTIALADPSTPTPVGRVTGLATGETLLGIDFRPSTGVLYGLGSLGNVYAIDPVTARATRASTLAADPTDTSSPFAALSGVEFGVDFNPTGPVALRVISDAEQNLRVPNVLTGATLTDLDLNTPAPGALPPDAAAAAYSNSFPGALTTTLFVIDVASGQLMTQAPPNNGVLTAVGALSTSLTFAGRSTFDIAGGANGVALAALQRAGTDETFSRLYRVDLATGAATELGAGIGAGPALRGLAIRIR
jgi:hypothetical protein